MKELFTPPYVFSESTFDETKDSAVECAKLNVDASFFLLGRKRLRRNLWNYLLMMLHGSFRLR